MNIMHTPAQQVNSPKIKHFQYFFFPLNVIEGCSDNHHIIYLHLHLYIWIYVMRATQQKWFQFLDKRRCELEWKKIISNWVQFQFSLNTCVQSQTVIPRIWVLFEWYKLNFFFFQTYKEFKTVEKHEFVF